MNTNFQFVKEEWPLIFEAAKEAEESVYNRAITSAMNSRQAMELMLNWMYDHDLDLDRPYQNTIAAKLRSDSFRRDVPEHIIRELELIRRIGNIANHSRRIRQGEALAAVKYLHNFLKFANRFYSEEVHQGAFDESLIPRKEAIKVKLAEQVKKEAEFLELQKTIQKQQAVIDASEALKAQNEKLKQELSDIKEQNRDIPIPKSDISEADTRRLYIDIELKAMGWDLDAPNVAEYELDNMPKHINPSGKGFADYVLWGDDGLPLAVIEAKKTTVNANEGKAQAVAYADALEKRFGRRPIIFYTNGFETWIWDDQFYPPRSIFGFYRKDELELLIERRQSRKDLRLFQPDPDIAGRYYQKEAIKRVSEAWVTDGSNGMVGKFRKALTVMATGTGKTRTAAAFVDIMLKANWAKRVLFLADRNSLVTQAKRSFNEQLPNLTAIDLTKEKADTTTRLVFSTYPTMLNRIDSARNSGEPIFGVGHFDLIIVDEAHRSIYKKYEDIFTYFDALMLGLTATPRDETHRDTYQSFDCEQGNPTYYYELDTAVKDQYLTPPLQVKAGTKFLQRGMKYADLKPDEQEQFEAAFAEIGEETPEEVSSAAINKWLFNKDTARKILNNLFEKGVKVDSGDKLGKTIIFAKNQQHAEFIETVFNEQFPEHSGKFAEVISYRNKFAQDAIDKFKIKDRNPQIAISVDMLDTGIDVPEIVNLVFFKPVYSKAKFWQMIGRGTRLCENLFAPDKHKEHFLVFDCCGNFEFFEMNPQGHSGNEVKSVSHRIFEIRMLLAEAMRANNYIDDEYIAYRNDLLDISHQLVLGLYNQRDTAIRVKMRLPVIETYAQRDNWNNLSPLNIQEISKEIGPLITLDDPDEKAKIFDLLLLRMQTGLVTGGADFSRGLKNLQIRSNRLLTLANIPAVREKLPLLKAIITDEYWKEPSLNQLEKIREELRALMYLLESDSQANIYMDIEDEAPVSHDPEAVLLPVEPENYLEKVRVFVRRNKEYLVIKKLTSNQPITSSELEQLEELLFDGEERGTKADYESQTNQPLGIFIREILGLDRKAAMEAFSSFLQNQTLTAGQQNFINLIIDHLTQKGHIAPKMLYESPYTNIHSAGVDGVFGGDSGDRLFKVIEGVNEMAVGA